MVYTPRRVLTNLYTGGSKRRNFAAPSVKNCEDHGIAGKRLVHWYVYPTADSAGASSTILVVDDDAELCGLIKAFFSQHGFKVLSEHDGRCGLAAALQPGVDLVILDVMMPVLGGFEVLHQLRRRSAVPVIMLTARTSQADRIAGLNSGADDYLPKPFGPEELLARIRAVLRRTANVSRSTALPVEVCGVRVNPAAREVWIENSLVSTTAAEYDILEVLIFAAGRVVSRDELAAILYQRQATPFERALDVHVSHLRKKLEQNGRSPIRTVRGVGYMFSAGTEGLP